jgi:type II restriction/modification system DNA methylase subunit YeeA
MTKEQIHELFTQGYNQTQWKKFLAETFTNAQLLATPETLTEIDNTIVSKALHLGYIALNENGIDRNIAVYEVNLTKKIILERNRVGLRNLLRKHWKNIDAAFIVYYSSDSNKWRFTYVSELTGFDDEGNFQTIQTEPKRYTYVLGQGENVRTATERFALLAQKARNATLNDVKDAFSVEKVTKEFYTEIAQWYEYAITQVQFPKDVENQDNGCNIAVIRMLTRLFFIWFMKEKGLIPNSLFDKEQLRAILNKFQPLDENNGAYYNAILQNLFFATLNTPMNQRKFRKEHSFQGKNSDYMNHTYYRYHSYFKDSDQMLGLFNDIPFLNGGLFECLDFRKDDPQNPTGKEIRLDGYSDDTQKQAVVPNHLFFSEKGIFNIFLKYHFTIEENTPFDQQVSLDPEMLGKIFENLLATYNPETRETARKATGSFYTPREIVYFMVKQSLFEHFFQQFNSNIENLQSKLQSLFDYSQTQNPFNSLETESLIEAIHRLKILDPAVGSGAFPMEVLSQLVFLLSKLDPKNELWKKQQIKAFEYVNDPSLKQKAKEYIESIFQHNELEYGRKLFLIQNCLFGVDLQPIAIHIAKLRFFLSLLVDEKIDKELPNFGIDPLPNLETNLIAANTLIGLSKQEQLQSSNIQELELDLFNIRKLYFETSDQEIKQKLKNHDQSLRSQIQTLMKQGGFPSDFADAIASADIYNSQISHQWFDPEWMLGVKHGFDIVIGNPPYIQLQKDGGKLAKMYEKNNYLTFARTGDIYALFYEKGLQILKNNGILCFITSNKWMRAGYGEKLRKFFTQYNPKTLIDLGPGVFESATVDTNILIIQKAKPTNGFALKALTLTKENGTDIQKQLNEKGTTLTKLTQDAWFIGSSAEQKLKEKIERIGKPLKDWDVNIYYGIKTGLNEAFIITTEKRNEILANCKDEEERRRTEAIIKPILRGRDIKRYTYEWAGLWVIATFPALRLNIDDYPTLKKYLLDKFDIRQLEQSGKKYPELGFDARKKTGNKWFETQDQIAYYHEFEKEKVVYSEIVRKPQFYYDRDNFYVEATSFLMTGKNSKYVCGLLNSKPITYFFKQWYAGGGLGEEGYRYKKAFLENLPLPPITSANLPIVEQIEALVDNILLAKQSNPQTDTSILEREIDQLVYKLYELTEEEIKIIEP